MDASVPQQDSRAVGPFARPAGMRISAPGPDLPVPVRADGDDGQATAARINKALEDWSDTSEAMRWRPDRAPSWPDPASGFGNLAGKAPAPRRRGPGLLRPYARDTVMPAIAGILRQQPPADPYAQSGTDLPEAGTASGPAEPGGPGL